MNELRREKLDALIAEVFEVEAKSITPNTTFVNDLDSDSLKRIVFIGELETLTGITLSAADLKYMETVQDLYTSLESWLS